MKNAEQIKEIIIKHEAILSYLKSQRVPFVKTLNISHEYDEKYDYNAVDIFKDLTSDDLNSEEYVIRNDIVSLIEKLNSSLNQRADLAKKHNRDIDQKISELTKNFNNELADVIEIKLSSRMDLTFKNINKSDHQYFIDSYLSLGVTHYNIGNEKHQIYYNADDTHFNTFKENIFKNLPLDIQKKYPNFVSKIQNNKLNTKPESNSNLFEVIKARK